MSPRRFDLRALGLSEPILVDRVTPDLDEADGALFVALREEPWDGHVWLAEAFARGARFALVARDATVPDALRDRCIVVDDTLVAFRKLAAEVRKDFTFPVIAVGGSNGKTTTKEMIGALVEGAGKTLETMNGWSGIPRTLLDAWGRTLGALVVEIGIDARAAMEDHAALVDPDIAVLTSIGVEHLAGLGSLEGVLDEELRLFGGRARRVVPRWEPLLRDHVRDGDLAVGDLDDGSADLGARVTHLAATWTEVTLCWRGETRAFAIPMTGRHHGSSFALAAGAALMLGGTFDSIEAGLARFRPPSMRCEVVRFADGGLVIDDAYNANPASMGAALALLAEIPELAALPKTLVLGDMLDLGDETAAHHRALAAPIAGVVAGSAAPVTVALFGPAMGVLRDALAARGIAVRHLEEGDPRTLVEAPFGGRAILVKGSRGMGLERVVEVVSARYEARFAEACAPLHPRFKSVCVTGTNGKTTTTTLVASIVAASGEVPCRVTTLGAWVGEERTGVDPTSDAFLDTLRRAEERGVRTLALETTSQSLGEGFAAIWPAAVAVFTNLSRDHLDHHPTPEHYLAAKAQLFLCLPETGVAVLNLADPTSALLHEVMAPSVRRLGYAVRPVDEACAEIPLALAADAVVVSATGTRATLRGPFAEVLGGALAIGLVGEVHVENALAAALAAHAIGYDAEAIRAGLATFRGVPGRFEIVKEEGPIVVVDYAHTPDALAHTLSLARALVAARQGRVVCVFGCGGDRDPGKRPEMGRVAASLADVVVVTSDNPRSEDPETIIDAICVGARPSMDERTDRRLLRMMDRRAAIGRALEEAGASDIVVIAGKGHEKTQRIGDRELPFDDVEVARDAMGQGRGRRET